MKPDSIQISIAMLKAVIAGETYQSVASAYGVTRSAVDWRVKALVRTLAREVGIEGLNEDGLAFVRRLRQCGPAILAALDRYTPKPSSGRLAWHILTDEDISLAVQRIGAHSSCPRRDVALFYMLLKTGARPLEIARLEVRDYLDRDGQTREESIMRAEVASNGRKRPLFFTSRKLKDAINAYLAERLPQESDCVVWPPFRGLDPNSRLFLNDGGGPFEIVSNGEAGAQRYLCRGMLDVFRKLFRRTGLRGMSALQVRRTLATRLQERGATEVQIGTLLGLSHVKSVRALLPPRQPTLHDLAKNLE